MEATMNELDPMDRTLVELARDAYEPTDDDRARTRGRLASRLGVAAGLAVGTSAIASSSAAAATGGGAATSIVSTALVAKLLGALIVVVAMGDVAVALYGPATSSRSEATLAAPRASPPASARHESLSTALPPNGTPTAALGATAEGRTTLLATASPAVLDSTPIRRESSPPERAMTEPPTVAPIASGATVPWAAESARIDTATPTTPSGNALAQPVPTTLEAETRLVRSGLAALHAGDATRALALFDEHARIYPHGVLADERDVEKIEALCALRRDDAARAAAASFLQSHGASPLAARARAACPAANVSF
jgi:hypothetical protein